MTNGTPDEQNTTGSGNGFLTLLVDGGDNMQPGGHSDKTSDFE